MPGEGVIGANGRRIVTITVGKSEFFRLRVHVRNEQRCVAPLYSWFLFIQFLIHNTDDFSGISCLLLHGPCEFRLPKFTIYKTIGSVFGSITLKLIQLFKNIIRSTLMFIKY